MKTRKVNTGVHEAQEAHEATGCRINEKPHNHPDTDCGHHVPGVGPGTTSMPNLNMYDEDHGKKGYRCRRSEAQPGSGSEQRSRRRVSNGAEQSTLI